MISRDEFLARINLLSGPTPADPALYEAAKEYGTFSGAGKTAIKTLDQNIIWSLEIEKQGIFRKKVSKIKVFGFTPIGRTIFMMSSRIEEDAVYFGGFVGETVLPPTRFPLIDVGDDTGEATIGVVVDFFIHAADGTSGMGTAPRAPY